MSDRTQRLTKRQQRLAEKQTRTCTVQSLHMDLQQIEPITDNQYKTFKAYEQGNHLFLHGSPGTGKTYISLFLALTELSDRYSHKKKVVIIRSAQSSKDIGFLPGDEKRKLEIYEQPYKLICSELYNRGDAYEILKQKGLIEFHSTSFLRGTTIDDSIVILDEAQNLRWQESLTVLSRIGENSRVLICGDTKQDDLTSERYKEVSGISTLLRVFEAMESTRLINFTVDDIVRSGFVKDFIMTMERLGI